jgi:hypothetical protein
MMLTTSLVSQATRPCTAAPRYDSNRFAATAAAAAMPACWVVTCSRWQGARSRRHHRG